MLTRHLLFRSRRTATSGAARAGGTAGRGRVAPRAVPLRECLRDHAKGDLMKTLLVRLTIATGLILSIPRGAAAVPPPPFLNYQGVLRDSAGLPITGARDMIFRLYSSEGSGCPAVGGTLLLTDEHLATGAGGVSMIGGLFSVLIGSGDVAGGPLPDIFRLNSTVALEVWIAGETLCPRTFIASAPNALNAHNAGMLDNQPASHYLDTSASAQIKAGSLRVNGDINIDGGELRMGGATLQSGATYVSISSSDPTHDLLLFPGPDVSSGGLTFTGGGVTNFYSGNGNFQFWNGSNSDLLASFFSNGDVVV